MPYDDESAIAGLLRAYRSGVFPMADPSTGRIHWFAPDPRGVIPLQRFHVPRSLARVVRSGTFEIVADRDFEGVMRACAAPRPQEADTWIDDQLVRAYLALHRAGHAHSVEARRDGRLVGGLYGVHVGGAFFGESMFVRPEHGGRDSSKVCLVHLVRHLCERGFILLDTQWQTEHLRRFGCEQIPREVYLEQLMRAIVMPVTWGTFEAG